MKEQLYIFIYVAVAALVSFILRVLPLTLIKKKITNNFIKSFLYYVPYVTLAVMTFPAIVKTTDSPIAGALALVAGILGAVFNLGMLPVAAICCVVAFIFDFLI